MAGKYPRVTKRHSKRRHPLAGRPVDGRGSAREHDRSDAPAGSMLEDAVARRLSLERVEQQYARMILDAVGGNKTEAAAILKIDRKTLYRKLGESGGEE